jgi:hypothetical protein
MRTGRHISPETTRLRDDTSSMPYDACAAVSKHLKQFRLRFYASHRYDTRAYYMQAGIGGSREPVRL